MSRVSSVEKGARKRGYLADGEEVVAVAIVGTGMMDMPQGGRGASTRWAVAATDQNVHVLKLGAIGFRSIKDRALTTPLEETYVRITKGGSLEIGTEADGRLGLYSTIPLQSPKKLVEFVESRSGVVPPEEAERTEGEI